MSVERKWDWPERLADYLIAVEKNEFAYGHYDCVLFAIGAIEAMTDLDMASKFRAKYKSARGAVGMMARMTKAKNLPDATDVFCKEWGIEEIPTLFAQRGDVVEADVTLPNGTIAPALGVVATDGQGGLFVTETVFLKIKLRNCKRAWRTS